MAQMLPKIKLGIICMALIGCNGSGVNVYIDTKHSEYFGSIIDDVFKFWWQEVGYMDSFDLFITDDSNKEGYIGGWCRKRYKPPFGYIPRIDMYTSAIMDIREENRDRTAFNSLLHEIIHAHQTCTDADHVRDSDHIMYDGTLALNPYFNPEEI